MNIDKLVRKVLLEVDGDGKTVSAVVNINDPVSVLTHAINTPSCFPAKNMGISTMKTMEKNTAMACGVAEGTKYTEGKTGNMTVYFFGTKATDRTPNPDDEGKIWWQTCTIEGNIKKPVTSGASYWFCKDAFAGISDINKAILSPEQENKLKTYVNTYGGIYSDYPPDDYTEQTYEKYDVKKIPSLGDTFVDFPDGKMFVYIRKGLLNATPDQVQKLTSLITTLTPKLTTKMFDVGTDNWKAWCITGKALFPNDNYLPSGISYENLKARLDDPNAGLKKGSWTLFCPDKPSIDAINTESRDMNKCRNSIKYLYSCKTKGGRSKFNQQGKTNPSSSLELGGGTPPCDDFKRQFKERYLAYTCNAKKMYDKTIDILGVGIKNEVNDLLSDLTTDYGLGTFNKNLKESIKTSNTLDYTINKVVLEAITNKKSKSIDSIGTRVKKNLLEEFKRRKK
jgi:hypothetical protein